jgi:hypothetical protein
VELFEARRPMEPAVITEIDLRVDSPQSTGGDHAASLAS